MVWLGPDVGSFDEMVEAAGEKEREYPTFSAPGETSVWYVI
jgi:hypothetical protein